jgi:hypothetical protein
MHTKDSDSWQLCQLVGNFRVRVCGLSWRELLNTLCPIESLLGQYRSMYLKAIGEQYPTLER